MKGVSVLKDAIFCEDSDSSPDLEGNRQRLPRPRGSVYIQSDSESDVPPAMIDFLLKESSEWLNSSRRKLQKFAFQKSKITNDPEETLKQL